MSFNAKKCYILTVNNKGSHKYYQLNNQILKHVDKNPYLGIILSRDLSWSNHIDHICNKASATLGFLKRNLKHCPMECRKMAYIALVRSTLEYGASIWDPHLEKDINKLENIQRKAARFITNNHHSREPGSMTNMLKDLGLQTLQRRRKENRLLLLFRISKDLIPAIDPQKYLIPLRNKRKIRSNTFGNLYETKNIVDRHQKLHDNCFKLPTSSHKSYKNSFFPKTISEWNELDEEVVTAPSVETFKIKLTLSSQ